MSEQKKYYIPGFGKVKMMNLDAYYLHATDGILGRHFEENKIISVLEDGKLKTRKDRKKAASVYNYDDELCLWDPTMSHLGVKNLLYYSAVNNFIIESPCLVLSRNIETFKPKTVPFFQDKKSATVGKTDMYDEVRHQGNISLEHLEFITFPIEKLKKMSIYKDELYVYKKEINLIKKNFPSIKVKDIFTGNDLKEESIDNKIEELEQKQFRKMALHSIFRR